MVYSLCSRRSLAALPRVRSCVLPAALLLYAPGAQRVGHACDLSRSCALRSCSWPVVPLSLPRCPGRVADRASVSHGHGVGQSGCLLSLSALCALRSARRSVLARAAHLPARLCLGCAPALRSRFRVLSFPLSGVFPLALLWHGCALDRGDGGSGPTSGVGERLVPAGGNAHIPTSHAPRKEAVKKRGVHFSLDCLARLDVTQARPLWCIGLPEPRLSSRQSQPSKSRPPRFRLPQSCDQPAHTPFSCRSLYRSCTRVSKVEVC
jgi:hypothetical protein